MRHVRTLTIFSPVVASLAILGSAVPAGAATAPAVSNYLAGYTATSQTEVGAVAIKEVRVPTLTCKGNQDQTVALGAGSKPSPETQDYIAAVGISCTAGKASYYLEAIAGDTGQIVFGVKPGNNVQITIGIRCNPYPTCDVDVDAVDINTKAEANRMAVPVTLTSTSATFGAFPQPTGDGHFLKVPDFETASFKGCLFGNHLIANSNADRVTRRHGRQVEIKAGPIHVGSFALKFVHS